MTIHSTSIASGKCFTITAEHGRVRRVVRLENGQVTYQERSRQTAPMRWGVNVVAPVADGSAEPSAVAVPITYAATAQAAAGGWIPTAAKPLLVGAAGGGLLTQLGVWIGYLLGRRS